VANLFPLLSSPSPGQSSLSNNTHTLSESSQVRSSTSSALSSSSSGGLLARALLSTALLPPLTALAIAKLAKRQGSVVWERVRESVQEQQRQRKKRWKARKESELKTENEKKKGLEGEIDREKEIGTEEVEIEIETERETAQPNNKVEMNVTQPNPSLSSSFFTNALRKVWKVSNRWLSSNPSLSLDEREQGQRTSENEKEKEKEKEKETKSPREREEIESHLCDALLCEPMPYRSAVEEANHVIVLRTRPDPCRVLGKRPTFYEQVIAKKFFGSYQAQDAVAWMLGLQHWRIYAEDGKLLRCLTYKRHL
jgi:hypothetical protein